MKFFIVLCLVGAAIAELPRFQNARFRFQRQELAPSTTDVPTTESSGDGPYPPSGWKPEGEQLTLPNEKPSAKQEAPTDSYGAPAEQGPYPPSGWKPSGQAFTLPNEKTALNQEAAPLDSYGAPAKQTSGPYPPSGWKPTGQAFTLPSRQEAQSPPATSYGAPDNSYGPPDTEYGAPTSTESDASTTEAVTDNPKAERLSVDVQKSESAYYLLLPNGQLQKVEVTTQDDPKKMVFSAQLRYPVRNQAPLFVFKP